jgi:protein subunit release factor B
MNLSPAIMARLAALGVRPEDIEERFIRGAGPGGQKINKTSSTVWVRHRPSGTEVRCQRERSQTVNRETAWMELCAKLEERRRAMVAMLQDERQRNMRRNRQKSRGQKARMIEEKKRRAAHKARRGRVRGEE